MVRKLVAVLFALALVGASVSAAQVGIGVSGQYLSLGGSDFEGTDAGFGAEGNVMFPIGTSIKLGPSVQYSSHDVPAFGESLSLLGIFGEGRYMLGGGGKATPYIGARVGYAMASASVSGIGDISQNGMAFGGGVGVMIAMSPTLAIDLNGMFHSVSLGDAEVDGQSISGSDASGTALQIRAGVNFKLGGQ
jgi:opacity protein-like surface antigen